MSDVGRITRLGVTKAACACLSGALDFLACEAVKVYSCFRKAQELHREDSRNLGARGGCAPAVGLGEVD